MIYFHGNFYVVDFISKAAYDKWEANEGETIGPMKAESFFGTRQGDRCSVKVVIWENDNGNGLDFEEGHRYKLSKCESRGNAELWSTKNYFMTKLTLTRCRIPSRQCLNFDQILSTTTPKNVDFVGKVVGVQEDGKRVIVEDVARKYLKTFSIRSFGRRGGFGYSTRKDYWICWSTSSRSSW